jgi:hypothetical protein
VSGTIRVYRGASYDETAFTGTGPIVLPDCEDLSTVTKIQIHGGVRIRKWKWEATCCDCMCAPMEVGVCLEGDCNEACASHGWYWNGCGCSVIDRCLCEGPGCNFLFDSQESCAAAHVNCPDC